MTDNGALVLVIVAAVLAGCCIGYWVIMIACLTFLGARVGRLLRDKQPKA